MKDMVGIDCKPHLAMPQRGGAPFPNGFGANPPTGAMRNAPTGQTVIAQGNAGNALGTNAPPNPPSPNGANVRVNHVAPSGQVCIRALHTQGVALGYRRLCRWHIGQNNDTPIAMIQFTKIQSNTWQPDANQPLNNAPSHDELDNDPPHDEHTRKDQTHDDPTFKSPTQRAPIRNARTRNAPTGQTVIAQGNALGTNVPPKPPSPNGANVRVNHVAPSGQMIIGGGHTQGDALGYHSLCRWHLGQNADTPIAMTQFTKIQSNTWQPDANQPLNNAPPHDELDKAPSHDEQTRKDQTHDDPTFKSPTRHAPIRNARTRNAPTGQTVIAQGNALGTNAPPKPPSPNGANVRVNHVAPLGQVCIRALHTQGDALGYHSLCRWHIGQNKLDQGMKQLGGMRK